jgi:hypothetical protein
MAMTPTAAFFAAMKIMAQGWVQWISDKMKEKKGPLLLVAHRRQQTTSGEVEVGSAATSRMAVPEVVMPRCCGLEQGHAGC